MKPVRLISAVVMALGLATAAVAIAHADPAVRTTPLPDAFSLHDDFAPQPNQLGPTAPHRSLQWDAKRGRWGLNLDMTQPTDRDVQWRDTRLGAYYRVTPRLRVGPSVSLDSEQTPDPHTFDPQQDPAPRVRLETTFKF